MTTKWQAVWVDSNKATHVGFADTYDEAFDLIDKYGVDNQRWLTNELAFPGWLNDGNASGLIERVDEYGFEIGKPGWIYLSNYDNWQAFVFKVELDG